MSFHSARAEALSVPANTNARELDAPLRVTSRGSIVGSHPALRRVLATIDRVARSNCTVLVTGESGTGKETVVAALHDGSLRARGPLVAVNCGAIPESLIESELFGHVKGAFTGAHANRQGIVQAAEGGTLFLDEIAELSLGMQVKILRLLEEREYTVVGDTRVQKCDLRVVVATHRDLEDEVAHGRFREDLYYRLNVVHVTLPSLRERAGDVEALAEHFLRTYAVAGDRSDLLGFSQDAMDTLTAYAWPGNIRALKNTIERAVLLSDGPWITPDDLPVRVRTGSSRQGACLGACPEVTRTASLPLPDDGIDLRAAVERYENALICQALERTGGNKNRAARLLGINRTTLVEMVKRKGLAV